MGACSFQSAHFKTLISILLIELSPRRPAAFPALGWWFTLAFACCEPRFLIPTDAAMSIQAFQNKFRRRRAYRIRLTRAQPQSRGLFHQALNARELLDHASRVHSL